MTSTSMLVLRKQSSACAGVNTIGSFSLKEVFKSIGTPLRSIARSVEKIADTAPAAGVEAEHEGKSGPSSLPAHAPKKPGAGGTKEAIGRHA